MPVGLLRDQYPSGDAFTRKQSPKSWRYTNPRISVKIVRERDVRMSQSFAGGMDPVRNVNKGTEFLSKCVKRFLVGHSL